MPSDVSRSAASSPLLGPTTNPATEPGTSAAGQEIARFRWEGVFLALDALPDGAVLFTAGDDRHRISDWLETSRIAPWVMIASRALRLSITVDDGDEVTFRTPQLRARQDAVIAFCRRFASDASPVELRIESPSTAVALSATLTLTQAQCFLASLGAAVGEAFELTRGAR